MSMRTHGKKSLDWMDGGLLVNGISINGRASGKIAYLCAVQRVKAKLSRVALCLVHYLDVEVLHVVQPVSSVGCW